MTVLQSDLELLHQLQASQADMLGWLMQQQL